MAVTDPHVDADRRAASRAAAVVASLHELTHPTQAEDSWLDWIAAHIASGNPPGTVVDLPVGAPRLRLVVIVPDDVDG